MGWARSKIPLVARIASVVALAVFGVLTIGCGPSPAYEPEYPQGYYPPPPPPLTAEELAARQQAQAQAQGEVQIGANADEYGDTDPTALTEFKPALEGHGTWVDDGTYGTVWVPSKTEVGADFQPYVTAGHWTYSDDTSYVWVSDYDWGWAPFHYGRWVYLPGHGWAWIPGRRYAGAWVTWRVGPSGYGYVGWAPAPPTWYWYRGYAVGWSFGWYHHYDYYAYCPHTHFYHEHVHNHVITGAPAREHYGRTADYQPASPGVGGGRSADYQTANPSVNGGGNRVVANPSVNGRAVASPAVGPKPAELGIKDDAVVAPPASHAGIAKAQAYASPRTAVAAGAAAPAYMRPPATSSDVPGSNGQAFAAPRTGSPYTTNPPPSSGSSGFASASPYRSPGPGVQPSTAATPAPYRAPGPGVSSSPPSSYSTPSVASPYRPPPPSSYSTPSSPSFRSSSPSVSSPAPYRSSPSFSSSPSFRSSSPSVSSPSFRSSPSVSSPSFRSSPSVSSPSMRSSSPSISRPSVSSPSRAAPSVRSGVRR